ncbi:MAG: hypothetical protein IIA03_16135, partial [Proteobacteria bacterium]|nr:hypothetical protein [Pseudomonadota bacterium]
AGDKENDLSVCDGCFSLGFSRSARVGERFRVALDLIQLRKDVGDALSKMRGRIKLPDGVTTDDVMRELRGRAPGDPYPPPDEA